MTNFTSSILPLHCLPLTELLWRKSLNVPSDNPKIRKLELIIFRVLSSQNLTMISSLTLSKLYKFNLTKIYLIFSITSFFDLLIPFSEPTQSIEFVPINSNYNYTSFCTHILCVLILFPNQIFKVYILTFQSSVEYWTNTK